LGRKRRDNAKTGGHCTVKIKKANLKRLASLSALGAGALGAASGTAQASSIVYSGILDDKVGFGNGFNSTARIAGPHGAYAILAAGYDDIVLSGNTFSWRLVGLGAHDLLFPLSRGGGSRVYSAAAFAAGRKWSNHLLVRSPFYEASVAGAGVSSRVQWTHFNSTDRYLLFEFPSVSHQPTLYGWAQLLVGFSGDEPEVTLVDYAYDTSGVKIPAGDTGTPEPSTFVLTGLAALALGAKGVRAWRAARNKAQVAALSAAE
jgi:hypothetical protein